MDTPGQERIRVLHVDDDPEFAALTARFLEREDDRLAIDTATSAAEGLRLLRDDPPDCIVSDYEMPETTGLEFLETVRAAYPDLPFIVFTGRGSEQVAGEAISAGATDYLQKESGTDQYTLLANRIVNAVSKARGQRAERYLRELSETTDHLLYVVAHDWSEVLFVNSAYETLWGRSVERLRADPLDLLDGVAPDDRDRVREAMVRLSDGDSVELECRLGADAARWVRLRGDPVRNEDGDVVRIAGFGTEITEQKHRERQLERYGRLVENLPVGVFRTTLDGELLSANETLAAIYGAASPAHLREVGVQELYRTDADRDRLLDRLRRTGQVENELIEVDTLDGGRRVVRATLTLVEADGTQYLDGIIQDVTERRALEAEFTQTKTITDALGDPVYVLDADGRFTYVNDEFARLVGYTKADILGSTPALIKDADAVARAERHLGHLLSSDGPDTVTFEVTIQPRQGGPIVCEDHMGVLPYEGDAFNGSVGVLRDVSELKRREEDLRRERDRLEMLARFVGHDLRTPLATATESLDLLRAECNSAEIDRIGQAHARMDALIDDLLTLAHEGDQVDELEPVDLGALAATCWGTVETAQASLRVETSRTIRCDPSRVQQLFENLYRNAIEHGGSNVEVTVGDLPDGFYVADDGPGIPADRRTNVFESGYSTAADGSGFGLCIVDQIVTAHGWTIRLTESASGGARFEITGTEPVVC